MTAPTEKSKEYNKDMKDVDVYLNNCLPHRKDKLQAVVSYLRDNYPTYEESCNYAPSTKFPVFKSMDKTNYVAVASQKSYIAIHFG